MSSFLEEKRQVALDPTNNTAQEQLLDFLETLHPAITDLIFPVPLTGDLDFNILKECNFTNITSIKIPPGNITSIRNLPDFITEFSCPSNLLIELENLPPNLVILDIKENGFKRLEMKDLGVLKTLDIRRNLFSDIRNLPMSLEKLYCSDNQIKTLDLDGIENLQTLYCENNDMITIENFPDTITDLRMEHNPNLKTVRENDETEEDHTNDITEALNKYFKLKEKYEKGRLQRKRDIYKIAKDQGLGKKAIENRLRALKIKCVKCGNPGNPEGTIFKLEERTYTAVCGSSNPCNLNIRIFAGIFSDLYDFLKGFKSMVEDSKSDTIQQKLDTLFNYTTEQESIYRFKEIMKEYSEDNIVLKEIQEKYEDIYENKERLEKIRDKELHIEELKSRINDSIKEYELSGNHSILHDAMESYAKDLLPEIHNLRYLMNEINEVIISNDKRILFQKQNQLTKIDYTFNEPPKVEKFII